MMRKLILILFILFGYQSFVVANEFFSKAVPVWACGREKEMNLTLNFNATFTVGAGESADLKITASTLYKVLLNGKFLGYGPARAAHGYFRVDEYDISDLVHVGKNRVEIEVAGYNVNTYYTLDQPSFLLSEIEVDGKVVAATSADGVDFKARINNERLQKVERYSFQRPFTEYYRMDKSSVNKGEKVKLSECAPSKLLPRALLMPDFNVVAPQKIYATGVVSYRIPEKYIPSDRSIAGISEIFKGYKSEDIDSLPSKMIQEYVPSAQMIVNSKYNAEPIELKKHQTVTLDFGTNLSGFIGSKIVCKEPTQICLYFDEMLTGSDVNTRSRQSDINNTIIYELQPGTYDLETFESYTFKYLKFIVFNGSCRIENIYLREYAYPKNNHTYFESDNNKINAIFNAAYQSFRQNSVDVLTDCPSRERAGWLCDSYFIAIVEKDLTGKSAVARNFYENYALPEKFNFIPDGMIPCCYPADHNDGVFIPNWSMWFILQVEDFHMRNNDTLLTSQLKPRIEKLLTYFEKFENSDGLLENLESWIFVEWSRANSFVDGVNYPSNMLYAKALRSAYKLYGNEKWLLKARAIEKKIIEQSFNGKFFVDNALRDAAGELVPTKNMTEVCQYYAFYFNIVTPTTHSELWHRLVTEFGPKRDPAVQYPDVFVANAFVGNYMRQELLSRYNLKNQLLGEVQDYFYPMAEKTGTLWENMGSYASCNHGFASYLAHIIYRDILGVDINYSDKIITLSIPDIDIDHCKGSVPIDNDAIEVEWTRSDKNINYKAPKGYTVKLK